MIIAWFHEILLFHLYDSGADPDIFQSGGLGWLRWKIGEIACLLCILHDIMIVFKHKHRLHMQVIIQFLTFSFLFMFFVTLLFLCFKTLVENSPPSGSTNVSIDQKAYKKKSSCKQIKRIYSPTLWSLVWHDRAARLRTPMYKQRKMSLGKTIQF